MVYTNSPLVTYTNITKNKTANRNHEIDTITIHCYVGQVTAKQGCDMFATTDRKCSANYVVGCDGSIGLSVEEKNRSWCSSNAANDHRAVTIEVASDTKAPYAVTDAAYNALIRLVADICKRNNIEELKWKGDQSLIGQVDKQNMTVHRWFAKKSCPGEYLYTRHSDIASKVNVILKGTSEPVQEGVLYIVQAGVFDEKENADDMVQRLNAAGFDAIVKTTGQKVESSTARMEIKVGSTVRLKQGSKTFNGGSLASFVYERDHQVKEINVDKVVITYQGTVVAAVKKCDLVVVD